LILLFFFFSVFVLVFVFSVLFVVLFAALPCSRDDAAGCFF